MRPTNCLTIISSHAPIEKMLHCHIRLLDFWVDGPNKKILEDSYACKQQTATSATARPKPEGSSLRRFSRRERKIYSVYFQTLQMEGVIDHTSCGAQPRILVNTGKDGLTLAVLAGVIRLQAHAF
jgi:hypothetical protein